MTSSITNGLASTNYVLTQITSNGIFGGVGHTNGVVYGNGASITNITLNNITNVGTAAYSNATAFYLNSNPSNYVTSSVTNGLATTNYVNAATNGLVTSTITNGLATTNYANSVTNNFTSLVYTNPSSILYTSSLPGLTNGFVTASVTNGLATTNYVNTATNGHVTASITNGLATTNYVKSVTNNFTAIVYSNPAAYRLIGDTNFPGIYITNNAYIGGYVSNNSGQFTFAMKGDTYGGSKLILQNRSGQNGPLFDGSDCTAGALIDFGLRTTLGVNYDHVFRLEQRGGSGQLYRNDPNNSGYGEIQFFRKQDNLIFASLGEYSSSIGLNPSPTTTNTFNVSGTTSLSGNTGIGTETPRGKLDVVESAPYTIGDTSIDSFYFGYETGFYIAYDNYYEFAAYAYKDTPVGRVYSQNAAIAGQYDDNSYSTFYIAINLTPVDGADGYRIIVNADPQYGAYDGQYFFESPGNSVIGYSTGPGYVDGYGYYSDGSDVSPSTVNVPISQLYFESSSSNIIIMPGKYVGIAITNPAYKLDVNGSGHFVGAVKFDANITGALTNLAMYSSTNYNGVLTNSTIRNATITNTTYYGNGVGLTNITGVSTNFATTSNPTNAYVAGTLYTNLTGKKALLVGSFVQTGASASLIINYTNGGIGYRLPIAVAASAAVNMPFSVPLSPNATFNCTAAVGYLTNTVLWSY